MAAQLRSLEASLQGNEAEGSVGGKRVASKEKVKKTATGKTFVGFRPGNLFLVLELWRNVFEASQGSCFVLEKFSKCNEYSYNYVQNSLKRSVHFSLHRFATNSKLC